MKKTTMMTSTDPAERTAAMAARIHRLSDPLTAMGQRSHGGRVRRELNARLILLAITLATTLAITGAVGALTDSPSPGETEVTYQAVPDEPEESVHIRSSSS